MKRLTCIDLFCGCGGFTLGMERAGFSTLAAVDFNAEAIETPVIHRGTPMWTITNDLVDDGKKIGTCSCSFDEAKAALIKHRFRLLDDDSEVYYEGLSDDCDSQSAFAPLDEFGKGYAGCTAIHYFTDGAWRQL